jgi:hypothetical protein
MKYYLVILISSFSLQLFASDTLFFETIDGRKLTYVLEKDAIVVFGTETFCKNCFAQLSDCILQSKGAASINVILLLSLPYDAKTRRQTLMMYKEVFPAADTVFFDLKVSENINCPKAFRSELFCRHDVNAVPALLLISPKHRIYTFYSYDKIFTKNASLPGYFHCDIIQDFFSRVCQ